MRPSYRLRILAVSSTLALVLGTSYSVPSAQNDTSPIRGVILKNDASAPVNGARVTIFTLAGANVADVRTDAQGRFEAPLPPGRYVARVALSSLPVADAAIDAPASAIITIKLGEFTAYPNPPPVDTRSDGGGESATQEVRVFYATDRDRLPVRSSRGYTYTEARSRAADPLSLGSCIVSVPRDRRIGQLDGASMWRLDFRSSAQGVTVAQVTLQDESAFMRELSARATAGRGRILLFVHGYNVAFQDACRRAGQITYDLAFTGAPVVYSWPSRGTRAAYMADEETIQWTVPHLREFIQRLGARTGASIHVLAHSMGSRAVMQALSESFKLDSGVVRDVIFAAPDIDSGVFQQRLSGLKRNSGRVTLYASSADRALAASRSFHDFPRAGESGTTLLVSTGLDTIDASSVETDFLGHSYFGSSDSVLRDLFELVRFNAGPDDRFALTKVQESARPAPYWKFRQ